MCVCVGGGGGGGGCCRVWRRLKRQEWRRCSPVLDGEQEERERAGEGGGLTVFRGSTGRSLRAGCGATCSGGPATARASSRLSAGRSSWR